MVSYGQGGAFLGTEMDLGDSRAGNAWVAVALVSASAWALQALKQQARADGGNGGRDTAPECLAGKLIALSLEEKDS